LDAPAAILPRLHRKTIVLAVTAAQELPGAFDVADTAVVPAGTASATLTSTAGPGPAFETATL
jgi:hypothetical protein